MAQENSLKPIVEEDEYVAFTPNQYTSTIWNYLIGYFTEQGVAALMGNMWAESGCTPYACQPSRPKSVCETYIENVDNNRITRTQFINGGCSPTGTYTSTQLGFGLVQWTISSRKTGLYDYIFPNYPNMDSHSIGNIYYQLEYVVQELTNGSYQSVGNVLRTSTNLNECSDIVLEVYENPDNQSQAVHELRRKYSQQVYDTYGSGTTGYHIYLDVYGNGTASVSNASPQAGETVTLTCVPAQGEQLLNIDARVMSSGQSMALDPTLLIQTFPMPSDNVSIAVTFSGETPPEPPEPPKQRQKGMPIWMYPSNLYMKGMFT